MRMVQLTCPDGAPIWVNPEQVMRVRSSEAYSSTPNAKTSLWDQCGQHFVREEHEDVVRALSNSD